MLSISVISPKANSFSTSITGTSSFESGQNIVLTFNLNSSTPLGGIEGRVNFDSKLTYVSYSFIQQGLGSFNQNTGVFNFAFSSGQSGNKGFLTVTFRASSSFTAGTTAQVSLTNVQGSNVEATSRLAGSNSSRTITYSVPRSFNNNLSAIRVNNQTLSNFSANTITYNLGATDESSINVTATAQDSKATISGTGNTNLSYGNNSVRIVVRAENGSTKTYTLNITRNDYRSSNNFLKSMTLSDGTLAFDKNRNNYTIIVDHDVTELTINVEKEDEKASIRDTSITKQLAVYSNVFEFTVVAENNARRTYSVNVVRRDADGYAGSLNTNNRLASLTIEGYEIDFDPEQLEYELFVDHPVSTLDVVALVQDETATMIQPGNYELALGENVFTYTVIAQDETSREYQLVVFRAMNLPPLPIEELLERMDEVEADVLNLKVRRNETLSNEQIGQLKASNKVVAMHVVDELEQVIGIWNLANNQIDLINSFNHGVSLIQRVPASLASLLNYAQSMVVNFYHEGDFDQPLDFTLNLNQQFDETYLINVYYYDEVNNRLVLKHENLEIKDDQITWLMDHASIYVVSPATFKQNSWISFDLSNNILLGVLVVLTLSLIGNLLLLIKVKKLSKRLLSRKMAIDQSKIKQGHETTKLSSNQIETDAQTSETMVESAYDKENQ